MRAMYGLDKKERMVAIGISQLVSQTVAEEQAKLGERLNNIGIGAPDEIFRVIT